jgi:periplasmic protein TonB
MSALALAMMLTGTGAVSIDDAQRRRPPPAGRARPARRLGSIPFRPDDYPAMEGGRQEGVVGFRLTIGPNGRVTDCRVAHSSGSASLDWATCRILRSRARYAPARDAAGNPTTGSDTGYVRWRLPEETRAPPDLPGPDAPNDRRR